MLVVIGTDCIGTYKSNYHTITTVTVHIMKSKYYIINTVSSWLLLCDSLINIHVGNTL